jgi:hypothetical protein
MLEDIDYRELSKTHDTGRNQIFGYIGSLQEIDFYECTTCGTYAAAGSVLGDKAGTVPTSVALAEAYLIGPGAVGFGTAAPDPEGVMGPVCRYSDSTNYGTIAKVIWYALHAIKVLDETRVQRVIAQTA